MRRSPQVDVVDAANMKWWAWCVVRIVRTACRGRIRPIVVLNYIDRFSQLLPLDYVDDGTASELIGSVAGGSGL